MKNRLVLAAVAALAACSPYAYQTEIDGFAKSVGALTEGTERMRSDILAEPDEKALWMLSAPGATTDTRNALCELDKRSENDPRSAEGLCRIKVGDAWIDPTKDHPSDADELKKFRPLGAYAKALGAVANAEDSRAFDAAGRELAQRANAFVAAFGVAPVGAAVTAGVNIVSFGARLSLEQSRLGQLRMSVAAVEPHFKEAASLLGDGLEAVRRNRIAALHERMKLVAEAFNRARDPASRRQAAEELLRISAAIRDLQTTDAASLVEKMAAAHSALAKALSEREPQLNRVLEELTAFADLAIAFRNAINAEGET